MREITKSEDTSKKNINNEIGNIFKGHNIFEYKSPKDKLNIDTFFQRNCLCMFIQDKRRKCR